MNTIPIAYEDDCICIINKKAGLATQGGKGIHESVDTLLAEQLGHKIHLVHRLDRDTSGLLIVAKNATVAAEWSTLIASKYVQKEYYAVCTGTFSAEQGHIDEIIHHKGIEKPALTHFYVEKTAQISLNDTDNNTLFAKTFSAVRLILSTGRMHQIRIHLASNGTPIAGDDKYGDFKLNKILKKQCGIKKLHLAAVSITFPVRHTNKNETTTVRIPLPEHMQKTVTNML